VERKIAQEKKSTPPRKINRSVSKFLCNSLVPSYRLIPKARQSKNRSPRERREVGNTEEFVVIAIHFLFGLLGGGGRVRRNNVP